MKPTLSLLKTSLTLLLLVLPLAAQQEVASLSGRKALPANTGGISAAKAEELRARMGAMKKRRSALRTYLTTVAADSPDSAATRRAIAELDARIQDIASLLDEQPAADVSGGSAGFASGSLWAGINPAGSPQGAPDFFLSRPVDRKTDESVQPTLAWTEDRAGLATKYIVEVSRSPTRNADGSFASTVFRKEVDPKGVAGQSITLGEDEKLEPGVTYYWHVLARYTPAGGGAERLQLSKRGRNGGSDTSNEPRTFHTAFNIFQRLEDKGFTLQRAVAGDDATEGAQFSFLRTFNKGTVYSTTFAFIHNHDFSVHSTWAAATQFSVEGALTSDESEAEDAWRFRGGVIIDRGGRYRNEALIRDQVSRGLADESKLKSLRGFYLSLAAKLEADQDFETRKFSFEGQFVPTVAALNMGATSNPDTSKRIQFRWRPYFGVDAGHTFRVGDSNETESTIFRLVPRVRPVLYLNFLRNALGFKNTYLYADNTFWYLPLENGKKRHNFFTSGFNLDVTQNFGFGLTYKNGESAPKFKRVNTLGGVLTVRFGKEN